jgi:hypothetical protein
MNCAQITISGKSKSQFGSKSIFDERNGGKAMAKTVSVIGIDPGELCWIRTLLSLLRHPDSMVSEMARQAMVYLEKTAKEQGQPEQGQPLAQLMDQAG